MTMSWYVVHTYSGYELKAKLALEQRIESLGVSDKFGEVLVPTEQGVEMRNGKKRSITRKFYPGYLLVEMDLDNETWHVVKNTPKVTGFVGGSRNPPPIPGPEIQRITDRFGSQAEEEAEVAPRPLVEFEVGEEVRVTAGAFSNMKGDVEEVNAQRGKLRVTVNIFGRPTPLELDFTEVEKLS